MFEALLSCGCLVGAEAGFHRKLRSEGFDQTRVTASLGLVAAFVCLGLLPLFVTGEWSFEVADNVCYQRGFAISTAWNLDLPENEQVGVRKYFGNAAHVLLPVLSLSSARSFCARCLSRSPAHRA